jgi:chromosome segregation ATPase
MKQHEDEVNELKIDHGKTLADVRLERDRAVERAEVGDRDRIIAEEASSTAATSIASLKEQLQVALHAKTDDDQKRDQLLQDIIKLQAKITGLSGQYDYMTTTNGELEQQLDAANASLASLTAKQAEDKKSHDEMDHKRQQDHDEEIQRLRDQIVGLESKVMEAASGVTTATESVEKRHIEDKAALQSKLDEARDQIREASIAESKATDAMKAAQDEYQRLHQERELLHEEMKTIKNELELLRTNSVEAGQKEEERAAATQAMIATAVAEAKVLVNQERDNEVEQLTSEAERLHAEMEHKIKHLSDEHQQHVSQLEHQLAEKEAEMTKLKELDSSADHAHHELVALQKRFDQSQQDINEAKVLLAREHQQLDELKAENESLRAQVIAAALTSSSSSSELEEELVKLRVALEAKAKELKESADEQEQIIQAASERDEATRKESFDDLERLKAEINILQATIAAHGASGSTSGTSGEEVAALQEQLSTSEASRKSLSNEKVAWEAKEHKYQEKLHLAKAAIQKLKEEAATAATAAATSTAASSTSDAEVASLREQLEGVRKELADDKSSWETKEGNGAGDGNGDCNGVL